MPRNLSLRPVRCVLVVLVLATWAQRLPAQAGCPDSAAARIGRAWAAYRADSLERAADGFRPFATCGATSGLVGLGFVELRLGRVGSAETLFARAIAADSLLVDAWEGLARAAAREGNEDEAVLAARTAWRLDPSRADLRALLDGLNPDWDRPPLGPRVRPPRLQLVSRTVGERFEISTAAGRWSPFYIQGVNLGVALPGRFPSEFPTDSALYAGWLDTLSAMHANAVRLYTILPPAFYRALRGWNRTHPDRIVWLVQGVWTELPPGHDFDDPDWKGAFRDEMRRVVNLVHGHLDLPPRPGHAGGRYDADVSPWTFGYILGREWEPFAVQAYDQEHPGRRAYAGRFLAAADAPALDAWMAEQCDYLLGYEFDQWNALRPVAYTNWPTLDPLSHPTESSTEEEIEARRRAGRPVTGTRLEYENDAVGLDPKLIRPTSRNPAGWFASYHAYPYYPDFMIYDPGYLAGVSPEGPSAYFAYLEELRAHHSGIPLLIAEYGVPSSRGVAHLQPQGWNHGGHDEQAMAAIDARLTRDIRASGAAGAIIFAWTDEWFKRNWAVMDLELPEERNRLWLNVMDAEQQYGILGQYAGAPGERPELGGDAIRWGRMVPLASGRGPLRTLRAGADAAYLYLALQFEPAAVDWARDALAVAIDTYRPDRGQFALPDSLLTGEIGFEFLLTLAGPVDGHLRVVPSYNPFAGRAAILNGDDFGQFHRRPATLGVEADGRFDELFMITNRARYGRDGGFWPAQGVDRGRLRFGTAQASTLSDWYMDSAAGLVEIRIPWALLNVTDPSSHTVLLDSPGQTGGEFGTASTDGFRIGAVLYREGKPTTVRAALPEAAGGRWRAADFTPYAWPGWEQPTSHGRLKPVYDSLRAVWAPR